MRTLMFVAVAAIASFNTASAQNPTDKRFDQVATLMKKMDQRLDRLERSRDDLRRRQESAERPEADSARRLPLRRLTPTLVDGRFVLSTREDAAEPAKRGSRRISFKFIAAFVEVQEVKFVIVLANAGAFRSKDESEKTIEALKPILPDVPIVLLEFRNGPGYMNVYGGKDVAPLLSGMNMYTIPFRRYQAEYPVDEFPSESDPEDDQ